MNGEGNMEKGIKVKVPKVVISGWANGSNTRNFHALCDNKGNVIRDEKGQAIHTIK